MLNEQYLTKVLRRIIPITMLLRVFETPLLNILLGLCPLFTPSNFWRRYSQLSHADTDYNATDLELSYRFSIDRVSIKGATLVDTILLIIANLPSAKASHLICIAQCHNCALAVPMGLEPTISSVTGRRDNHYTTRPFRKVGFMIAQRI